jgi:glycosyltransferase involved in cell wall biosynthesis
MPTVSIVIPAYNAEPYIPQCLDSLLAQSLKDLEIVVVDDFSTDGTVSVIQSYSAHDTRIRLIRHERNRGRQQARRTGVMAAQGKYILLLDNDDELLPDTCMLLTQRMETTGVDVLHYGITVVAEAGLPETEAKAFAAGINTNVGRREGEMVMRYVFDEAYGYAQDWRITQRIIRSSLFKDAFERMGNVRLDRGEDAYESFVVLSLAKSSDTLDSCKGYVYHYGRGDSGTSPLFAREYGRICQQFLASHEALARYVHGNPSQLLHDCYCGCVHENLELIANEWLNRVPAGERHSAMRAFARSFGYTEASRELCRFVRDRAYELLATGEVPSWNDPMYHWWSMAKSFAPRRSDASSKASFLRYEKTRKDAQLHLNELRRRDHPSLTKLSSACKAKLKGF